MFAPHPLVFRILLTTCFVVLLPGCDLEALLADPKMVQREGEGKAIGGACRYALRGIEDCYTLNPKALKTAMFAGWKEMDFYMRENKIDGQVSVIAKAASTPEEEIITEKNPNSAMSANERIMADSKSKTKPKAAADKQGH